MKKQLIATIAIISAGIIAGCGGSGSGDPLSSALGTATSSTTSMTGNSTSSPAASSTTSIVSSAASNTSSSSASSIVGKVADGYLSGATVFLDRNGNYQLDTGEPSATTDANGAFTLKVDPTDVGKFPVVALAIKGVTIDKDTGQAVANSYVLSMHAVSIVASTAGDVTGTVNNFISPISTQVREMMETGTYSNMQQAMESVRTKLGLPAGTNMMADYIAASNTTMHTAAQNIASLMGSQMTQVIGAGGLNMTVDVNRYRGMIGVIFSNMSSMRVPNFQKDMTTLVGIMTTELPKIPATSVGVPYRNMSTTFRGMMGGVVTKIGGMMGGK